VRVFYVTGKEYSLVELVLSTCNLDGRVELVLEYDNTDNLIQRVFTRGRSQARVDVVIDLPGHNEEKSIGRNGLMDWTVPVGVRLAMVEVVEPGGTSLAPPFSYSARWTLK